MLADNVGEEEAHKRLGPVVKLARWAVHNMFFWYEAVLSYPFVDWRLIGVHAKVIGDEFFPVRCGKYVVLELRSVRLSSNALLGSKESSVESWVS